MYPYNLPLHQWPIDRLQSYLRKNTMNVSQAKLAHAVCKELARRITR
jgi:hypothetical protein